MITFIKKYWVGALVILVVIISVAATFYNRTLRQNSTSLGVLPSVRRVEPLLNSTNIGPVPDVVVYFDADQKADQVSLKTTPDVEFAGTRRADSQILFRPKTPLQPSTNYSLTVYVGGQARFSWQFTTKNFSVDASYADKVNKAKAAIPFDTAYLHVSYDPPDDSFAAYEDNKNTDRANHDLHQWFASLGINDTKPLNILVVPINFFKK